jgi:hypothetical protein
MTGPGVGPNEEDDMRYGRFGTLLGLTLIVAALVFSGGCSRHYVDVYINEICALVYLDNDPESVIEDLFVFEGDYVIFNNTKDTAVELTFPVGLFEVDEIVVEGHSRVFVKVIGAALSEGTIGISGDCPAGAPKVKVGEGP